MERAWAERFGVKHALSMNSATSALNAAAAAAGVGPGDEVIVSPYTMTASAVCALVHGAIPVFADIEPDTFCLDPESVRARITPRTKAIVAVDIFGCPADFDALMAIAREHDLVVIEDAAQAPGATLAAAVPAGTLGHIGVFSLNYHKTIQCGEGGVAVTDDDTLAERLALARNHGEAVVADMGSSATDVLGFNYRLGELEAAIAEVQLSRLDELTAPRIAHAERLTEGLVRAGGDHAAAGARRTRATSTTCTSCGSTSRRWGSRGRPSRRRCAAEGVPVTEGYVAPIYRQPLYQERAAAAFGDPRNAGSGSYATGTCATCERMHDHEVLYHPLVHAGLSEGDIDDIVAAFRKVHARRERADPLKLLVAAHDAGGAEIIAAWLRRGRTAELWLDGPARAVFARRLPERRRWPRVPSPRASISSCAAPAASPTTSGGWCAPRATPRVRSVVWLDHWVNYPARFDLLPDELWVCDEHAARIARETVPGPPVHVRGNPYLEDAAAEVRALEGPRGAASGSSTSPSRRPRSPRASPATRWAGATTSATRCAGTSSGRSRRARAAGAPTPGRTGGEICAAAGRVRRRGERRNDARRGHRVGGHGRRLRHDGDGRRPRRRPARDLGDPARRTAAVAAVRGDRAVYTGDGQP